MPQLLWKGAVLAAALGLAVLSGAARAQDAETLHPYLVDPAKPHPVLNLLHVPVPCWASHNGYSCSSFRSEATFLFGSCRAFYGEPCIKGPPPPPWADDGNVPPRGCGCRW
jgi:hypothetical protein